MTANRLAWLALGLLAPILGACDNSGKAGLEKKCSEEARAAFLKDIGITEGLAVKKGDVFAGISRAGMSYEKTEDRSTPGCNIKDRANKTFFQIYHPGRNGQSFYKIAIDGSGELIYVGIVRQNTST